MPEAVVISLDSYYRDLSAVVPAQRENSNFDEPAALDHELMAEHLGTLAEGGLVQQPIYDFATHTRAEQTRQIEGDKSYIVVEGLFALYWDKVRRFLQTRVFINVDDQLCLSRRLQRDVRERHRTLESVRKQYDNTVRPMFVRYVEPTRQFANLIVQGELPVEQSAETILEFIQKKERSFSNSDE